MLLAKSISRECCGTGRDTCPASLGICRNSVLFIRGSSAFLNHRFLSYIATTVASKWQVATNTRSGHLLSLVAGSYQE